MITIRDYAAKKGCTVQNIYKLLKKYDPMLSGHYSKVGSKTFLDKFAQTFLDKYITPKALLVTDNEMMDEINKLRAALSESDHKAAQLAQQNADMAVKLQKIDSERLLLESNVNTLKDKNQSLVTAKEELETQAKELAADISNKQTQIDSLKQELEKRDNAGLFTRIFKKW